jgi:uncharacterized protein
MQPVLCVLIGAFAGMVAALCGVGGGVLMVPAFVLLLHMGQKTAVATSLAVVIFTSIAATAKNASNQFVDWKTVGLTALASVVVVWFAADLLKKMSNITLTRIFAVFMIVMGAQMLIKSCLDARKANSAVPPAAESREVPDKPGAGPAT